MSDSLLSPVHVICAFGWGTSELGSSWRILAPALQPQNRYSPHSAMSSSVTLKLVETF